MFADDLAFVNRLHRRDEHDCRDPASFSRRSPVALAVSVEIITPLARPDMRRLDRLIFVEVMVHHRQAAGGRHHPGAQTDQAARGNQ